MDLFAPLIHALPIVFEWQNILAMVGGVIGGIMVGALPGLSATMAISILLPLTFGMNPMVALGMMAGIYNGAMYGGAIPAVLLRIPGTPAAIATTFDGYPLARKGEAGTALQTACIGSAIGGMVSAIALITLAPPLSLVTLAFGPPEIFWVAVFGLASIGVLVGRDPIKGLLSACLGLLVGMVGIDEASGFERYTFDILNLVGGFHIVILLVGLYAMPPAFEMAEEAVKTGISRAELKFKRVQGKLESVFRYWRTLIRTCGIGIIVGLLPGAGGNIAALISYNEAKRASKDPDSFGEGNPEGVLAAECGNNADNSAAMVPALTLGIPGSSVSAVILGGLLVHGLQPGPNLFRDAPDIVYGFMVQMFITSLLIIPLGGFIATNVFAQVLRLPRVMLLPLIIALTVVGVYAIQNSMFDVYMMLGFGLLGYAMEKLNFPLAPAVLGLILGSKAEFNLRISYMIGQQDWSIMFTRPISQILIVLVLLVLSYPFYRAWRLRRQAGNV